MTLGLLLAAGIAAQAQPGPRTGPDAVAPPLPPFAAPPVSLPRPNVGTAPLAGEGGAPVASVQVVADAQGPNAQPPAGWRPVASPDFTLQHQPGEALDAAWVERQFAANPGLRIDRALALVQLLNQAFLGAGFVNSGLLVEPSADPSLLRLRLVHGRAIATEVDFPSGSQGLDAAFVRRHVPSASAHPLNVVAVERDFRLLASEPWVRTVNAQLLPGDRAGEARLALSLVPADRFDLYLTAANNRSPAVGGYRAAIGGYVRSGVVPGDLFSAEVGITEGVADASAAYVAPILAPELAFTLRGSFNDAAVVDRPLIPLDIRTRDRAIETGFLYRAVARPLTPREDGSAAPAETLTFGLTYGWRAQRSFLLGEPFSFAPGSVDGRAAYQALRGTADYIRRGRNQVLAASVTVTQGLDGTRAPAGVPNRPRTDFRALLFQLSGARRLSADGLEARARLTAQVANSTLYSGERLSLGGEASVRGYRETLLLGDHGVAGSLELSHPVRVGPEVRAGRFDWGAFSVFGFAEGGFVATFTDPQPVPDTLFSIGTGFAWTPSDAISLRVAAAVPLIDSRVRGERDLQDRGLHVRLTVRPLLF